MAEHKEERSVGELFSRLANETTTLLRQEVQLAKVELGQKAAKVGRQVAFLVVGGAIAYAGLLAVLAAAILLMAQYMPGWLSALIVGLVIVGIGYLLTQKALHELKNVDPMPRATVETLKQGKEWAKEQLR